MSERRVPGERLYSLLLRLHPVWFRERYEAELLECYRDGWRAEAAGRGWIAVAGFWLMTAGGIVGTVWRQRKRRHSDGRRERLMGGFWQDVRIGTRTLFRRPGWAAVVILTLGLGMGASIAMFAVFHAVLLAPFPYGDSDRLARVYLRNVETGTERLTLSAPAAAELRDEVEAFAAVAIVESNAEPGVTITGGSGAERVRALGVSSGYFDVISAVPLVGRVFERHEETADARVAVVTEDVAVRFLGGVAVATGRSVRLDGVAFTVIGVVDDDVRDPLIGAVDVWLPADLIDAASTPWDNNYLDVFALLEPGTSIRAARAELAIVATRHAELGPAAAEKQFQIVPLRDDLVGSARPLLLALAGAVGFLLLLTCSNVASLLLARAAIRERELAIRATLGSTRGHLVRYFLVESGLVAAAGALCGLVVGWFALEALLAIAPADLPLRETVGLSPWTSVFAAGLAAAVGLILGIATSLPYARPTIGAVLAEGGRSGQGGIGARRTRAVLVVVDVALAVVLLVGAGILFRTLDALRSTDLGVDTGGVVAFDTHLPELSYPDAESRIRFQEDLQERLEAIPGIDAAGATSHLPVTGSANTWGTRRASAVGVPFPDDNIQANQRIAGGSYFTAVGSRLLAGRLLDARDGPDAPLSVVVNESLVRALFGGDDPLGQILKVSSLYPVIVGVVADIALTARTGSAPMVFHSYAQFGADRRWPMTQVVRIASGRAVPWSAIRSVLADVDPDLVLHDGRSLDAVVVADIGTERFAALLFQAFAALALILASLGLYGVLAHAVERRRHEIGVRMALGAGRGNVRTMIMRHGLGLAVAGIAFGLAGAFVLSRALRFLVFGVTASDPLVFLAVAVLLFVVAIAASYLPARQATQVEPVSSLGTT